MPSRRKGHFVQIWRPVTAPGDELVWKNVAGRNVATTVRAGSFWAGRWNGMSRELDRRRALDFAKEYARQGFHTRVVLTRGRPPFGVDVIWERQGARRARRGRLGA